MKRKLTSVLSVPALCLLATATWGAPFSVTCQPGDPGRWVYTLHSSGKAGEVAWVLDLNWVADWDEHQTPQKQFKIVSSPEDQDWFASEPFPFPGFDSFGEDPVPGQSVTGFRISADEPAMYFRVYYMDELDDFVTQEGSGTMGPGVQVPEQPGPDELGDMVEQEGSVTMGSGAQAREQPDPDDLGGLVEQEGSVTMGSGARVPEPPDQRPADPRPLTARRLLLFAISCIVACVAWCVWRRRIRNTAQHSSKENQEEGGE